MPVSPEAIAFAYFLYLAVVALMRGGPRARRVSVAALVLTTAVSVAIARMGPSAGERSHQWMALELAWRLALLLTGYRVAGAFYEGPNTALEARLLAIDHQLLGYFSGSSRVSLGSFSGKSRVLLGAVLEAAYLSVYPFIPAGAIVVLNTGAAGAVDRFWVVVLVAGFVCYGALPFLQTRPPRSIEGDTVGGKSAGVRQLNLAILERGSIGVNTLPSGHASTAVAVALSVWSVAPGAGAVFALLAILIAVSTVVGRYHYAVDTVLGIAVGLVAWLSLN